uniref:VM domain-containing protein n=1 Tax=Anopheles epiroticus TaxID=199890 RepID=A0A182PDW8_9DIPT
MAMQIALVCLVWVVVGALGQCGEEWYGGEVRASYRPDGYASVEDRSAPSYEEPSEEYYSVKRQRSLRSSRYSPVSSYRYGNDYRQDSEDDWERYEGGRKSHYDVHKARRKYDAYGKSSRSDYGTKGAPLQQGVKVYERKKTSRAAKYAGEGAAPGYGKTTSLTYKAVPPKASCAQNLLIGCTPTVTRVPCSASSPYHSYGGGHSGGVPYYPPAPVYHHAPAPAATHYPAPHPAPYAAYGHPPPSSHYPAPSASHGAPVHQKEHGPADYHHAKPSEDAHGYGPSYKAATPEEVPGFAAPVQEEQSESPKVPIISAFLKPSEQPTGAVATPSSATLPSTQTNGTAAASETTTTKSTPQPGLTPAPTDTKEENDTFWDENAESSTDVIEGSAARKLHRSATGQALRCSKQQACGKSSTSPTTTKMNSFIAITLLAVIGVAIAAPSKYGHAGGHHAAVVPGPAVVHTYPAVAPVVKCGHNLLVSCDPHHHPVPCKAAHGHHEAHHGGYGHHAPAPAPAYHHAPAPHYAPAAPAYHAPAEHGEYRAKHHKKHHKKHGKGKSADNVGDSIDSSSEAIAQHRPSCPEANGGRKCNRKRTNGNKRL